LVLAPFSGGQPKSGVEKGPEFLLNHGVQEEIQQLGWETSVTEPLKGIDYEQRKIDTVKTDVYENSKYPELVSDATKRIHDAVKQVHVENGLPVTLGGDHSIAIGTVSASFQKYPNAGLLWIDAHADINTPSTTESGNLHGCPVSFLMGLDPEHCPPQLKWVPSVLKPNKIAYIGLRDIDAGERKILKDLGIAAFSMYHVDKYGINKVVELALDAISGGDSNTPIHLSYDVDAIDPLFVPATGTPVRGGLTLREGLFVAERIAESGNLIALDVVECNPDLASHEGHVLDTISAGVAVAKCALGETLL
jgi:arginase